MINTFHIVVNRYQNSNSTYTNVWYYSIVYRTIWYKYCMDINTCQMIICFKWNIHLRTCADTFPLNYWSLPYEEIDVKCVNLIPSLLLIVWNNLNQFHEWKKYYSKIRMFCCCIFSYHLSLGLIRYRKSWINYAEYWKVGLFPQILIVWFLWN